MNFDNLAGIPYYKIGEVPQLTRRVFLLVSGGSTLLGDSTTSAGPIRFQVVRNRSSARRYLHIHGNETTSREVLREHMRTHRGTAHFIQSVERHVRILGGEIDPNRMFSREGAEASLRRLNKDWSQQQVSRAIDLLDRKREKLIRALSPPRGGILIAMHNNARGYSVKDEVPISDEVALNDPQHPHEFFLAVQPSDFRLLAKGPYNAVLQNTVPRKDDGSFSRLAAKRGMRYVNLEVTLGEFAKQQEMLNWLERTLP